MVTHLTSTGNSPLDVGRMPSTDTCDLAETFKIFKSTTVCERNGTEVPKRETTGLLTLVSLARQLLGSPTGGDTVVSVTGSDCNDIDHLVLLEDGIDGDGLLKERSTMLHLVGNGTTIDLNLHQVRLLLLERGLADLGVGEDTDYGAVLLDALELAGEIGAVVLGVLLGVAGEGLLLALVPVLVEAALDLVAQMLSPDGGEGTQATGSLDVTDQTNNDHL